MLSKNVAKSKIGSKGFNWLSDFKLELNVYLFIYIFLRIKFSFSDNITAKNSKTKYYKKLHITRCSRGLRTGVPVFLCGEVVKLILWTFYINHEL